MTLVVDSASNKNKYQELSEGKEPPGGKVDLNAICEPIV
jgi:hypothetical protein